MRGAYTWSNTGVKENGGFICGGGAYRWKNGTCIDVNCNPLRFSCGIGLLFQLSNNPSPSFH